jgi:signal transduction histidine kinase/DNA-binding NarL/FixJ family response regulator
VSALSKGQPPLPYTDRKAHLDSLERLFFSAKEDTVKRNRLDDLMQFYAADPTTDPEESFRQMELLVQKKGDPKLNYLLLLYRVYITHTNDSIIESRKYLTEFLGQCRLHHDKTERYVRGLMMLSNKERFANNHNDALRLLFNALDFARDTLKDKKMVGGIYLDLGIYYYEHRDTLKAIESNKKSLQVLTEAGDTGMMASVNNNLALQYNDLKQYDSAKFYYRASIRLFNLAFNDSKLRLPLINLGVVFRQTHDYDSALYYIRTGMKNAVERDDEYALGSAYWELAKTFHSVAKPDSAEKYFLLAKENIQRLQPPLADAYFYPDLAAFYASTGNHKLAYEYLQKAVAAKDLVFNADNNKVLKEMDAKYQAGQKAQEILRQEEQIKRQRILNYSVVTIAAIFLLLLFFIYRSNRLKQKSNKLLNLAKEKAEQSERFKQQFLANMSHEIRTPMNAVMGMTNLLIDKNPRSDQQGYLEGIKKSSETLLYIINDILDLSKIEAGKMELEKIDFSVHEVVEQVKQTLSFKADEKGLQFITRIDDAIPEVVMGDPVRLNQILMNLGGNAIKFTESGSVELAVGTGKSDQSSVFPLQFSITDTGIGISKEKLQSVFEKFSQANASDTRKYGGTGLGLSISKQLVELHGGKISVESEEGKGTVFSFTIHYPIGSKQNLLQRSLLEHKADGSILNGLKILVAEDNEYNVIVVTDTLKLKADVTILTAANGKEALSVLEKNEVDVILMDVQMPEMNGFEASQAIRRNFPPPKNAVPIIALTASVLRTDLDRCIQAGMNAYVPKPFKAWQLISAIAEATGKKIKQLQPVLKSEAHPEGLSTITDLSYLRDFCEGDTVKMTKYIALFLKAAPVFIETINASMVKEDRLEIANQVHGHKTKWMMMGMHKTNELAVQIEHSYRQGTDTARADANTEILLRHIQQAVHELTQS